MGSCFHFLPRRLQYLRQDIFNRLRRDTSIDESQACARPSFARGTDGSNPPPSSGESTNFRFLSDVGGCRVKSNYRLRAAASTTPFAAQPASSAGQWDI